MSMLHRCSNDAVCQNFGLALIGVSKDVLQRQIVVGDYSISTGQ